MKQAPMKRNTAPTPLIRICSVGYFYALHEIAAHCHAPQSNSHFRSLEQWILHLGFVNILFSVLPAIIWAEKVNLQLSISHLEAVVQYFIILVCMQYLWQDNKNGIILSIQSLFYLTWYVWQNIATCRNACWVQSPAIMQTSLVFFILVAIPAIWVQVHPIQHGTGLEASLMISTFLCDLAFIIFKNISWLYSFLLE